MDTINNSVQQFLRMLKDGQRIWVRNLSNPAGVLSITLGEEENVAIPKGKKPYCLTDHATEDALRKSIGIRKLLALGVLSLVSDSAAMDYYRVTGEKPNVGTVNTAMNNINRAIQDKTLEKDFGVKSVPEGGEFSQKASPSVIQMTLNMQHPSISTAEIINHLLNVWDSLTPTDRQYVMATIGKPEVVSWMVKQIALQQAGEQLLNRAAAGEPVPASAVVEAQRTQPPVQQVPDVPNMNAQAPQSEEPPAKKSVKKTVTRKRVKKATTKKKATTRKKSTKSASAKAVSGKKGASEQV